MPEILTGCFDVWLECILDLLKTAPILLIVYLFIGWLETRMDTVTRIVTSAEPAGPIIGALVGSIPQCGFSTACSALYVRGFLAPAALISVYLATSDEAIPVLLAGDNDVKTVVLLIIVKIIIAVVAGYLFYFTLFRKSWHPEELPDDEIDMDELETDCSCCQGGNTSSFLGFVIGRTINTLLFLLATMLVLNTIIYLIGEDTVASLLLQGSVFQPILCALIGLIPGCAVSVFLTQLLAGGAISFGSAVAGLSAGAGFGFILLLREAPRKDALKIIGCTYLAAVIAGMLIDLIF